MAFWTAVRRIGKGGSETTAAAFSAVATLFGLKLGVETRRDFLWVGTVELATEPDLGRLDIVVVESNLSIRICSKLR